MEKTKEKHQEESFEATASTTCTNGVPGGRLSMKKVDNVVDLTSITEGQFEGDFVDIGDSKMSRKHYQQYDGVIAEV